jgi:hypothetical protein
VVVEHREPQRRVVVGAVLRVQSPYLGEEEAVVEGEGEGDQLVRQEMIHHHWRARG